MNMGGFVLHEGKEPKQVLFLETMKSLLQDGQIDLPEITEEEIQDRSKSDGLSKAIAIGQTSWFLIQVIARHFEGLAVTELELVTAALAVLNGVIYFLWWNKPLDVRRSIPIQLLDIPKPEEERVILKISLEMGSINELQNDVNRINTGYNLGVFLFICLYSNKFQFRGADTLRLYEKFKERKAFVMKQLDRAALWCWKVPKDQDKPRVQRVVFFIVLSPMIVVLILLGLSINMIMQQELDDTSKRVPSFWGDPKEAVHLLVPHASISAVIIIVFGIIHCIGWHFQFPSNPELILWRVSSATVVVIPIIICSLTIVSFLIHKYEVHAPMTVINGFILVAFVGALFYFTARIFLLLEALIALRALPEGAYRVVSWVTFIPHI
jgi:hypothetical protein